MNDLVDRLLVVLSAEEDLYARLRVLLDKEASVLAQLDAEGFSCIVREKEELTDEGRLLEETRIVVAAELASELGIDVARPRLSLLCDRLGDRGSRLRAAHNRLVVIVGVVRELLETNANLARGSLGHVRATLSMLGGTVASRELADVRNPNSNAKPGQLLRQTA